MRECRETAGDFSMEDAIMFCSQLIRQKDYDPEVAAYVKTIF